MKAYNSPLDNTMKMAQAVCSSIIHHRQFGDGLHPPVVAVVVMFLR
jgi:hypothetical protein